LSALKLRSKQADTSVEMIMNFKAGIIQAKIENSYLIKAFLSSTAILNHL
jgi:hypothetical protein